MAKMMKDNSLNDEGFVDYLKKLGLERIECETAGYEINIPNVKTALHVPLYQTNTSQFCPLYALAHNKDRGQQRLVYECDMPCRDNAILYPDHLKMVGLYNSLFAVDTWLPDNLSAMDKYKKAGVDRIVLNYIPEVTI